MPELTGISHVELTVRDVERSAAWYEQVLGMRRIAEYAEHPTDGVTGQVVNLVHPSGVAINVMRHAGGDDGAFSERRVGLDHLALAVDSRDELEKWVQHFEQHGVYYSPINDQPYGAVVVFRDPDNIQLELFFLDLEWLREAARAMRA